MLKLLLWRYSDSQNSLDERTSSSVSRVWLLFLNQNHQEEMYDHFLHCPASNMWRSVQIFQQIGSRVRCWDKKLQSTSSIFTTEITTLSCPADTRLISKSCKKVIYSLMMSFIEISTSLLAPRRSSLIRPAQNKRSGVGEGVRRKEVTSCGEFSLETTLRVFGERKRLPPSVSIHPVFTVISRKTSATTVHQIQVPVRPRKLTSCSEAEQLDLKMQM